MESYARLPEQQAQIAEESRSFFQIISASNRPIADLEPTEADAGPGVVRVKRPEASRIVGAIAAILGWSFAAISIFQTFLPGIVLATPGMPINGTLIALGLGWLFSGISWFFLRTLLPLYLPAVNTIILVAFLIYFRTIGGS
jgi:hypothetical protein